MWLYNACICVWKLQNSKHFNLVQKSSRYLECNKSYDQLHPGTTAQSSSQIPVGAQGFVGSPPHPGCIMIYSYHQMCPALNSKSYWSNKQVVPLLGCCSDAPGSRTIQWYVGIKPFSNSIFGSNPSPESTKSRIYQAQNLPAKNCCPFATLHNIK